ncbi:MAG: hypothetical protein IKG42_04905 [Clostridia bacterium]|nr:hypothetical protein [Clostridia bacterium]
MEIKLYDKILLKDKREGVIIEIYKQGEGYEVEFMVDNTGEYPEYETETIKHEDIEKVIN